ncbi:MAG: DUF6370 family protein [Verrucomicrobiia bacterium]
MNKRLGFALAAAILLTTSMVMLLWADVEKTITGNGMCAMCVLKQGTECQTVIQVKEGDKMVTYYLVNNDVSKNFHHNVCMKRAKVTATGTVKEVDGKMQMTATKLELVKEPVVPTGSMGY